MKATRDWFGEALLDIAASDSSVVVVNCDLGSATKTLAFRDRYPDRFFEAGIAEANAIGVAAGLALDGYRPFVASFGHFLTGKFLEIFQSVGLNDAPVVLVGTHAGLAIGKDGPTQMGLRDLALMRTLPNFTILQPADGLETAQVVQHLADTRTPAYLRLCRQPTPEVHDAGYRFELARPDIVRNGRDLLVLTMGGSLPMVLEAADQLATENIRPTIVNVSSLPTSPEQLTRLMGSHQQTLVVEDHYQVGGLADEAARTLTESGVSTAFSVIAVSDYGQAGSPNELYQRYGLDSPGLAQRLRDCALSSAPAF